MTRKISLMTLQVLLTTATATWADGINAQSDSLVLEEVVVTATKRGETVLSDTPLAISVADGFEIEQLGRNDLSDVLLATPGVFVQDTNGGAVALSIRGLSSFSGEAMVGMYIDDLAFNSGQFTPNIGSFDLERVEVLKGPQGTLYGVAALGGVVRMITREADSTRFEAKLDTSVGFINKGEEEYEVNAALNIPVIENVFAIRAAGGVTREGGWVDYIGGGTPEAQPSSFPFTRNGVQPVVEPRQEDANRDDRDWFRIKASITPSDQLSISASYWDYQIETRSAGFTAKGSDPINTSAAGATPGEQEYQFTNLALDYQLTENINIYGAVSFMESSTLSVLDLGILEIDLALFDPSGMTPFGVFYLPVANTGVSTANDEVFSGELRISGASGDLSWLLGGFYREQELESEASFPGFGFASSTTSENEGWAIFGEVAFPLFHPDVELTLGGRYYEEDRSSFNLLTNTSAGDASGIDLFSPRINLAWRATEDSLFYFNFARGFRSPAFNDPAIIAAGAGFGVSIDDVIPFETAWSYEIGTKASILDGKVNTELAIYYNDWQDFQLVVVLPGVGLGFTQTVPEVRGIGVDFGISAALTEGLTVSLSGNYNDTELQSDVVNSFAPNPLFPTVTVDVLQAAKGDRPSQNSQFGLSASLDYMSPGPVIRDFSFIGHVDYQQQGRYSLALGGDLIPPDPFNVFSDRLRLVNARIGLQNDSMGVYLYAENLLNSDHITQSVNPQQAPLGHGLRARPRVIGLNLKLEF